MDDLISRQRAIAVADSSDYVGLSVEDCKKVTDEVVKGLKQLPSAQPEPDVPDTNVGDMISRQAAIDAINHICPVDTEYDCTLLDRVDVRYVLSDLPSAQPERIRGRWKPFDLTWGRSIYACSVCGQGVDVPTEMGTPIYRYCPHCGADMREEGK